MGKALYRKYRSKNLGEIVGQEHITRTLQQALKTGRISHAYLFTGPRGTGKTSTARILAHEINNLPYADDSMHMDIIEIDAASNRRIDEIRDLRDKVHIAPTSAKYKVYIIDEVHMLTREAFNALLKTLEEPPAHVIFILATTEAHKLPETITSRTQRYSFKPADPVQTAKLLATIAQKEGIDIDEAALRHIAKAGEGSFRDSISLLDQAGSLPGKVDEQAVQSLLGIVPVTLLEQLVVKLVSSTTSRDILEAIGVLYDRGYQAPQLSHQLISYLRTGLIQDTLVLPLASTLELIDALLDVSNAHEPERRLEITLLEHASALQSKPVAQPVAVTPVAPPKNETKIVVPEPKTSVEPTPPVPITVAPKKKRGQKPIDDAIWPEVVNTVRAKYYTLYSVLKTAEPIFNDEGLELRFDFAFHQKRINEVKNKTIIADILLELTGQNIAISCIKRTSEMPAKAAISKAKSPPSNITDIFGGAELLES